MRGVPQGSLLGPLLLIIYVKNLDLNISNVNFNLYAHDTDLL